MIQQGTLANAGLARNHVQRAVVRADLGPQFVERRAFLVAAAEVRAASFSDLASASLPPTATGGTSHVSLTAAKAIVAGPSRGYRIGKPKRERPRRVDGDAFVLPRSVSCGGLHPGTCRRFPLGYRTFDLVDE